MRCHFVALNTEYEKLYSNMKLEQSFSNNHSIHSQCGLGDFLILLFEIAKELKIRGEQEFTIVIQKVICYPQCFAAIADCISNMEGRHVVADIGSWTKDIVCIDNKRINVEQSVTISQNKLGFDN